MRCDFWQVREVFDKIDTDGNGTIDRNELKHGAAMCAFVSSVSLDL